MMHMQSTRSDLNNSAVKQRKMKTKMTNRPSHLHNLKEGVSAVERRGINQTQCPDKNKPKTEWAINKMQAMQAAQQAIDQQSSQQQSNAEASTQSATQPSSNTESNLPYWAQGINHCQIQAAMTGEKVSMIHLDDLKNLLILDSASSEHVVCNKKLVDKIWQSNSKLALATNGGPFILHMKGKCPRMLQNMGGAKFDDQYIQPC